MPLNPGARLGPYEIIAKIGAGGMGEVYRARDTRLGREVAVKVLPEHLAQDPQALARFEREARAVAALSHPNILALFDVGLEGSVYYAVTELLEGETLRTRLSGSAMPWRKATEIVSAVADGLAAAHAKGITHRDLKPENIFLTSDSRVKILDFGLARWRPAEDPAAASAATETEAGTVMGTVGYMAPEQVRGERADAPADIFALGCVLYEMVSGRRAFARAAPSETLAAILRDEPPAPLEPADLNRLVARCLEKSAEQRIQSARDLAFDLRDLTGARAPQRRLRPAWIAAAAAVLLVIVALVYILTRQGAAIDSLAVLPFVNAGGDPNTEYLSDGITENLINNLSRAPRLRVVPRSLVFGYKGRESDPRKAGRELKVRAVLTGRVLQRGATLNIQAELMDMETESQLWGEQYNRRLTDIITVQEEISREIAEKLRLRLTTGEQKHLTKRYTDNTEAHQLYLKGRYYWNRRTEDGLRRAAEAFQQSIEKDPGYALGYAGLADTYVLHGFYSMSPPAEAGPRAKAAARKALEIDESLAEPHASLAMANFGDYDWTAAEREFRRSIELNPNYWLAHLWFGVYWEAMARPEQAIAESRRALELDPLSLSNLTLLGLSLHYAHRYDEAIEQFRKTLDLDPNYANARMMLGMSYEQKGKHAEALAELQRAAALAGNNPMILGPIGHIQAVSGRRADAQKTVDQLLALAKSRYVPPAQIALIHAGLGDKQQALDWLEKAVEDRSAWLVWIRVDQRWDSLRSEPRFSAVLQRMNLGP